MEEQVEQGSQELSDHDLQDVTGGLSDEATAVVAGTAALGTIVGGGLLWQHLEDKHNERLYGKSGAPNRAKDLIRVVSKGRLK